jgi:hypothetical protein
MRRSQAPAGFHNLLAQCPAPQFDRGSKAAEVGKGCHLSLWPDEPPNLDAPAQQHDLIAGLNLIRQAGRRPSALRTLTVLVLIRDFVCTASVHNSPTLTSAKARLAAC